MSEAPTFFVPGLPKDRWEAENLRLAGEGRPECVYAIVYRLGQTVIEATVGRRPQERTVFRTRQTQSAFGIASDRVGPARPTGAPVGAIVTRHTACDVYDVPATPGAWADPLLVPGDLILRVVPFSKRTVGRDSVL